MTDESANRPVRLTGGGELRAFLDDHRDTGDGAGRVLVEFYTKGCGICQSIEPIVTIAARQTGVPTAVVNPGDDLSLVEEFDIRRVPTLVLFEAGEAVARYDDGYVSADELVRFVETKTPTA